MESAYACKSFGDGMADFVGRAVDGVEALQERCRAWLGGRAAHLQLDGGDLKRMLYGSSLDEVQGFLGCDYGHVVGLLLDGGEFGFAAISGRVESPASPDGSRAP